MNTKVFLFISAGLVLFLLGGFVMNRMVQAQQKIKPLPFEDGDWNYWSNYPDMYTIPDGYVGIGTTHPRAHLHVEGDIYCSGNVSGGIYETDIVTGNIPWNINPPYVSGIGFTIDVSSEITSGFTLIEVIAKGRKTDLGGNIEDPPLNLFPKVNGTNIEILIWDNDGIEYLNWSNNRADINYTLFMKK